MPLVVLVAWSQRNRSALIRIPLYKPGSEQATRAEIRCPDPACNPYLTFAALLHAGLEGIEQGYELPDPMETNLYHLTAEQRRERGIVPARDARRGDRRVLTSELLRKALGKHIFDRYVELKRKEWDEYRVQLTDWEMKKYLAFCGRPDQGRGGVARRGPLESRRLPRLDRRPTGRYKMRIEGSVTAISWIPSEAIEGMPKLPFELGIGHYDEPPPDRIAEGDLERLRDADRFREANLLRGWIEVEDGKIVDCGYEGGGLVGSTTFRLGPKAIVVPGVAFEILRPSRRSPTTASASCRPSAAARASRRRGASSGKPFFQIHSATAWTTLALTIRADGTVEHELVGASPFPRHWIYGNDGELAHKSGHDRLQDVVPRVAQRPNAVGRRGLAGGRRRRPSRRSSASCRATLLGGDEKLEAAEARRGRGTRRAGRRGTDVYLAARRRARGRGRRRAGRRDGARADARRARVARGGRRTATLRALTPIRFVVIPWSSSARVSARRSRRSRHRED